MLSMKFFAKPDSIRDIMEYLSTEYPEEGRQYIFLDHHPDNRYRALSVRSRIFPRLSPDGKSKIVAPIFFVPIDKQLPLKKIEDIPQLMDE